MKENKYRGKRIDNGNWVYGSLITDVISLTGEGNLRGQITIDNKTPFVAIVDNVGCVHQVDPETVGQSIGREDRNGQKIYEGDICRKTHGYFNGKCYPMNKLQKICGEVIYSLQFAEFRFKTTDGDYYDFYQIDTSKELVNIGNIHDNSELLESVGK